MRVAIAIAPEVRELLRGDPSQLSGLLREIHDEDLADLLMQLDEEDGIVLLEPLPEGCADTPCVDTTSICYQNAPWPETFDAVPCRAGYGLSATVLGALAILGFVAVKYIVH